MEEVELQSDRRDDLCEWSHMYAKLWVYFFVKKKSSESKSDSEYQQSVEHNV